MSHTHAVATAKRSPYLQFKREISIGDLITSISILISLLSVLGSWAHDRQLKEKDQADKVRAAAAQTLVKLDRWESVSLSVFDNVDPAFVDAKEALRKGYMHNNVDFDGTRHVLWKNILQIEADARKRALDDHLELGYVDLYTYDVNAQSTFSYILSTLTSRQEDAYDDLLGKTQDAVLKQAMSQGYSADQLYNSLIDVADNIKDSYRADIATTLKPLKLALTELIKESDENLRKHPQLHIPN